MAFQRNELQFEKWGQGRYLEINGSIQEGKCWHMNVLPPVTLVSIPKLWRLPSREACGFGRRATRAASASPRAFLVICLGAEGAGAQALMASRNSTESM